MTSELITTHSKEINKKIFRFYLDYPMGSYIPKWKVFRAFTNENKTIAKHIGNTSTWKKSDLKNILDIGTGDGAVLKNLCTLPLKKPHKVTLVEPNRDLLIEAHRELTGLPKQIEIKSYNKYINQILPTVFGGIDLVLVAHVLYLIPSKNLHNIIECLPVNVPVIIVTDGRNSLFPTCWEITAPKYYKRSQYIHTFVADLDRKKFSVLESSFKTFLRDPFKIDRLELMNSILSLICYTDYETLNEQERRNIFEIVKEYSIQDLIYCNSVCYEITKVD